MGDVREIPPTFLTSDGLKFPTEAEAKAHQDFVDCQEDYEAARKKFERAAAATLTTADGKPFKLRYLLDYYFIQQGRRGPTVVPVTLEYDARLDMAGDRRGWEVVQFVRQGETYRKARYPVKELYFRHDAAAAVVRAGEVAWWRKQLAAMSDDMRAQVLAPEEAE